MTEFEGDQQRFAETSIKTPVPTVTMGASIPGVWKPAAIDQVETSRKLTHHLIEQGFHNIGIITGPHHECQALERLRGWKTALQDAGLPADDHQICEGDWTTASGRDCMAKL